MERYSQDVLKKSRTFQCGFSKFTDFLKTKSFRCHIKDTMHIWQNVGVPRVRWCDNDTTKVHTCWVRSVSETSNQPTDIWLRCCGGQNGLTLGLACAASELNTGLVLYRCLVRMRRRQVGLRPNEDGSACESLSFDRKLSWLDTATNTVATATKIVALLTKTAAVVAKLWLQFTQISSPDAGCD